jgi:hypothetical protein
MTSAVIERFLGSIKYEHLYRTEIQSGIALAMRATEYRRVL